MSLPPPAAVRPHPARPEALQREHELSCALEAARVLQARLEMVGDRIDEVRWVHQLRDDLAQEIHGLHRLVGDPPYQPLAAPAGDTGEHPALAPGRLVDAEVSALARRTIRELEEDADGG